ncbi:unnamed protein product [Ceratitis capitata]|uniref:(Mediterranean fruit fly) hypothetical protein n=1 Tax=Ceratitis capitata TaxID=7213 RepID=A0A811UY79_CERCA|nr:unnamed protein product [Ceratitis capitata]
MTSAARLGIEKAKQMGNCSLVNGMGESVGIIGIRGNKTVSPLNFPTKIVALLAFPVILVITRRVSLHSLEGSQLRSRMIGDPRHQSKVVCSGISEMSNEFENSIGKFTTSSSSTVAPIDFNDIRRRGNNWECQPLFNFLQGPLGINCCMSMLTCIYN